MGNLTRDQARYTGSHVRFVWTVCSVERTELEILQHKWLVPDSEERILGQSAAH